MFLAFEWVDWAGKDTQMRLFIDYLIDHDKHLVFLKSREPSRMTEAGQRLNMIAQDHLHIPPEETALLFARDRRGLQGFRQSVLQSWSWIISSRCDLSTYAYQGWAMGLGFEKILELHEKILAPDKIIFITISVDTMLTRLHTRGGPKELYEDEWFLRKCHEGYVRAIEFLRWKWRDIIIIDGEGSIEEIAERVRAALL